jgi:hypothetical protein
MKTDEATLMHNYNKWLDKEHGYTRSTMTRNEYSKQQKSFSEAGLKRTNFRCSIKQYTSEKEYMKAKAIQAKQWRKKVFGSV